MQAKKKIKTGYEKKYVKYSKLSKLNYEELDKKGYYIIHNFLGDVNKNILEELNKQIDKRGKSIFGPDKKRKQCTLYFRQKFMKTFVDKLNYKLSNLYSSSYTHTKWNILKSLKGCKRQTPHQDFIVDDKKEKIKELLKEEDFSKIIKDKNPLSVIYCPMNGSKLNVWLDGIKGDESIINLKKDDLLIFKGDFTHAGSAYDEENVRLHTYIDNLDIPHKNNRIRLFR